MIRFPFQSHGTVFKGLYAINNIMSNEEEEVNNFYESFLILLQISWVMVLQILIFSW